MKLSTNLLYERFPIFGYSTLHKYKNDKESRFFFSSKKDLYLFLEANYLLEFKARKKLIKTLDFKNIFFFSFLKKIEEYIYEPNPIKSLIKSFKKLNIVNFPYFPEIFIELMKNMKDIEKNQLELKIEQLVKNYSYDKQTILENFENKLLSKDINYFDQWIIIEMILNIKKYLSILIDKNYKINYGLFKELNSIDFDTNNNLLKITIPTNNLKKQETFFLEFHKKSNKIIIREKIESNRNQNKIKEIRTKKLEEPKWVFFQEDNIDKYIDHLFNFIEVNYEDKYFQYNLLRFPLDKLI